MVALIAVERRGTKSIRKERKHMEDHTKRSKFWRVIPFSLILLVMLVSGGIALAGVPAGVPAGIGTAPPPQGKGTVQQGKIVSSGPGNTTKTQLASPQAPFVTLYTSTTMQVSTPPLPRTSKLLSMHSMTRWETIS